VGFDPVTDYPLGSRRPDLVATPSGLPLDAVTLDAARDGTLRGDDVRATAETLALQARVARAASRPQVSVNGDYLFLGNNALANQNFWIAAATADWTLFDGGASRRRGQAFEEQQRAALRQQADQAAAIALEVRTRWLSYEEAQQRIAVSRVAVAQAEENVNVVRDRYRQQLSTYTEVLDAERQRVQAQVDFATATYDAALAFFRLRRAVGDL